MLVIVILAALAGFGIVSYRFAIRKAENTEAIISMDAIRKAEYLQHAEKGSFLSAQDTAAINRLLGLEIQEKLFKYKIVDADNADFMIIAERISMPLLERDDLSMNAAGQIQDIFSTAAGIAANSIGSIAGTGGGSGSSPGTTGTGGSSGGGSGSGGSGGVGGGSSTLTSSVTTSSTSSFQTSTECPYSTTTLAFISRCDDMFTDWSNPSINITGVGAAILLQTFNLVDASSAHAITDDLEAKGILISFSSAEFLPGQICDGAIACFIHPTDPAPGPLGTPQSLPYVIFDVSYMSEAPEILAAILVHEGTHFQEFLDGDLFNPSLTVVDMEFLAFWNESAYWDTVRPSILPIDTPLELLMKIGTKPL